jgi:EpsI family protein
VIIFLLSVVFLSISLSNKNVQGNILFESLNESINGWSFVRNIAFDSNIATTLEPKELIMKTYKNKTNGEVTLIIVYHHNNRWGAHDPDLCYTSQGWHVIEDNKDIILKCENQSLHLNELKVHKEFKYQIVYYYWFSSTLITESREKQLFNMVKNGLVNGSTKSGFVRISVDIDSLSGKNNSVDALNDFTCKFNQLLKKILFKE